MSKSNGCESLDLRTTPSADVFWFALHVKTLHERAVADLVSSKGYEEFTPVYRNRRRWSDRMKEIERPLFPGYVFCRFNPLYRMPILTTPFVYSIVGIGKEPVPILDGEIEALKCIARSGLGAEPWPFLSVGSRLVIDRGPLRGVEGILLRVKQNQRLVVSVTLLQRSVAVEIDESWVVPLEIKGAQPPMPRLGHAAV